VRIVHFSDTYLPRRDGVITSLRTLVAAQTADGDATLTIVPRHPDQLDEPGLLRLRAVPCGVANLRLSPWLLRGGAASGPLTTVANFGPHVIHVHTPGPVGLLGVVAAQRLGLPLVQTYHTDLHAYAEAYRVPARALRAGVRLYAHRLDRPRPQMRLDTTRRDRLVAMDAYNALLLGGADAVVVPTRAVLDRVVLPISDEKLFVVPTGVAARPTSPPAVGAFRARCGLGPADRVVLFVGRINREKGVELLISAFAMLALADPAARLVLVGAIFDHRWLDVMIRALPASVAGRIVMVGEQPPDVVAAAYVAADVFAFPSSSDTQALVLQEAALAGRPAVLVDPVLHRHGPLGHTGVLAPATADGLASSILSLLADPRRARSIGAIAAAQAAALTPARYADAMADVYGYAMRRTSRSGALAPASTPAGETLTMAPEAWSWKMARPPARPELSVESSRVEDGAAVGQTADAEPVGAVGRTHRHLVEVQGEREVAGEVD
jgi:1,2-diacylglycerol 3-alpha-glucosyltransferase